MSNAVRFGISVKKGLGPERVTVGSFSSREAAQARCTTYKPCARTETARDGEWCSWQDPVVVAL